MYHLIVNAKRLDRKNRKKLEQVTGVLDGAGKEYKIHYTDHKGHARQICEKLSADGEENTFVAMGGDGVLHDIVNGITDFSKNSVALIPMGTGNDFAAAAGIPRKTSKAARIILNPPRQIDYIQLSSGLRSLNAVGMGIDVDVLKRAYAGKNKKKSKYFRALLVSLSKFKSYHFNVRYNDGESEHYGLLAAVGNGKQIGGGIKIFPDAEIDDGRLDLLIVDYLSKFKTVIAFIKLMTGRLHRIKEVTQARVKSVTFIPKQDEYTIQAEGELYENMPIDARVIEKGLKFHLPLKND